MAEYNYYFSSSVILPVYFQGIIGKCTYGKVRLFCFCILGREKCDFKDPSAYSLSLQSLLFLFQIRRQTVKSKGHLILLGYFSACPVYEQGLLSWEGEESLPLKKQKHLKWFPFKTDFYTNVKPANKRDT